MNYKVEKELLKIRREIIIREGQSLFDKRKLIDKQIEALKKEFESNMNKAQLLAEENDEKFLQYLAASNVD